MAWKLEMAAARHMDSKRYDEAINCFREVIEEEGESPHSLEMMALCYEQKMNISKAKEFALRALEIETNSFGALKMLARFAISEENYSEARDYVLRALESYPEPLPEAPLFLLKFFRFLRRVAKFRKMSDAAVDILQNMNKDTEDWYRWAKEYLEWYESQFGEKSVPTCH